MSPKTQKTEVLGTGFALERVFRKGTRVKQAFDNALLRQRQPVVEQSFNVNALSHYDTLDHVKNGNLSLATRQEVEEMGNLYPEFEFTALKKKIRTPVAVLYNKAKFGKNFDLMRQGLIDMINAGNRMSFGATHGASRSAIRRFLATPEFISTPLLREKVQNVSEHPQIAFLGNNFATDAVSKGYDLVFVPTYLAKKYYKLDHTIGMATVNGKDPFVDNKYELFQEIEYIIHN